MLQLRPILLAATIAAAISTSACKTDPASPSTSTTPRVGSTFDVSAVGVDSNGVVAGSPATVTFVVTSTTMSVGGKTNVTAFVLEGTDTMFVAYDANGNFSYNTDGYWVTLPTGSKNTITLPGFDTTIGTTVQHYTAMSSYLGTEKVTIGSASLDAVKVKVETLLTEDNSGDTYTSRDVETYWYVPSVGFFGRYDTRTDEVFLDGSTQFNSAVQHTLESYSLK